MINHKIILNNGKYNHEYFVIMGTKENIKSEYEKGKADAQSKYEKGKAEAKKDIKKGTSEIKKKLS